MKESAIRVEDGSLGQGSQPRSWSKVMKNMRKKAERERDKHLGCKCGCHFPPFTEQQVVPCKKCWNRHYPNP